MDALMVGAGSVGQVYGAALARGGARVSLLVKPVHAEECGKGFALYSYRGKVRELSRFKPEAVYASAAEAVKKKWDTIFFCMPTTGLRGPETEDLIRGAGDATIVTLVPGIEAREYLLKHVAPEKLVTGMINLIAYHAPLPGETVPEPGTAYWLPPLSKLPFSGEARRVAALIEVLGAGGLPSARVEDVSGMMGYPDTLLGIFIAGLRHSGWTFGGLVGRSNLRVFREGLKEATGIVRAETGQAAPRQLGLVLGLVRGVTLRSLACAARWYFPFDIETYLRVHFTKVGPQMREGLQGLIAQGEKHALPVSALKQLAN